MALDKCSAQNDFVVQSDNHNKHHYMHVSHTRLVHLYSSMHTIPYIILLLYTRAACCHHWSSHHTHVTLLAPSRLRTFVVRSITAGATLHTSACCCYSLS